MNPAMIDLLTTDGAYRRVFEAAPNGRFSIGDFNSGNEGAGMACAALLEKPVDLTPDHALSLLWSCAFVYGEEWYFNHSNNFSAVWGYTSTGPYMNVEFEKFVMNGSFAPIEPYSGRRKVRDLLQYVQLDHWSRRKNPYKTYSVKCFGKVTSPEQFEERLVGAEYLRAFEIKTEWNDMSYFFETTHDFGYFEWGTSA